MKPVKHPRADQIVVRCDGCGRVAENNDGPCPRCKSEYARYV